MDYMKFLNTFVYISSDIQAKKYVYDGQQTTKLVDPYQTSAKVRWSKLKTSPSGKKFAL